MLLVLHEKEAGGGAVGERHTLGKPNFCPLHAILDPTPISRSLIKSTEMIVIPKTY